MTTSPQTWTTQELFPSLNVKCPVDEMSRFLIMILYFKFPLKSISRYK
ncbi:MAG: hypothetical protein MjAS7_2023 [Metallosphaera javensis (ex Sakai et al. 2022)]|nr:MAG: hypothetical protein MjAS7_2023 [Metallosphaera javensis (ex Sakai et al. 2022)]